MGRCPECAAERVALAMAGLLEETVTAERATDIYTIDEDEIVQIPRS
jgi:hypothetical protein